MSQFERSVFDLLANGPGTHTLRANTHGLRSAVLRGRLDILEVRQKDAPRNAGHFRTDAAEILGFTTRFDMVSDRPAFSADFTYTCHEFSNLLCYFIRFFNEFVQKTAHAQREEDSRV